MYKQTHSDELAATVFVCPAWREGRSGRPPQRSPARSPPADAGWAVR